MKNKELLGTKCTKGNEFKILRSGAGYYLGTLEFDSECGCNLPCCRVSKYYSSEDEATESVVYFRECSENDFCSQGKGCRE